MFISGIFCHDCLHLPGHSGGHSKGEDTDQCSEKLFNILQVLFFDTEGEDETFQQLEQQKTDNKKYNDLGFIPDYDGYIS